MHEVASLPHTHDYVIRNNEKYLYVAGFWKIGHCVMHEIKRIMLC